MGASKIRELPIFSHYNKSRFKQFCPQDCANFYIVKDKLGKKELAIYPTMGRRHVTFQNINQLIFEEQPREIFKSISFSYYVVGSQVYQVDKFFNVFLLPNTDFNRTSGLVGFDFLPAIQTPGGSQTVTTFCMLTDEVNVYVIDESNQTMTTVTDANAPENPTFVAAFGNRFAVSALNSTEFRLTDINLGSTFNPATTFTINGGAIFAQESGIIRQMAVAHNRLYIFTDFSTGIWSNYPSQFNAATFPWRKNTTWGWDVGLIDANSLSVGFGLIVWLARNSQGLAQFMMSDSGVPKPISTPAVNTLLQNTINNEGLTPFLADNSDGFLYQYEDSIFYRVSAGKYLDFGELDITDSANCLEYNFDAGTWSRAIEVNGERCRTQKHIYFNNMHLVTVEGENSVYQMRGDYYVNEIRNPEQPDPQAQDAYLAYPFRYELVTPIIFEKDYAQFQTNYVQIDFVFGENNSTFYPPVPSPGLGDSVYDEWYKPHIELLYSDDGGISFYSADVREFSQLGHYKWRMRWYSLGVSENRVYKLVAVSPWPIVVLGAVQSVDVVSVG